MADDARPLGAALAAARRERGLSVEDVSAATRIRPAIVRAIENDDFDACGGAVYARGHLRSIAQVVGADPRPLVEEFDRRFNQPVPALRTAPLGSFEPPRDAGRSGRQSPTWASVAAGVLVVVVIFLGASWLVGRGDGDPSAPVAQSVPTSAAAAPTKPTPTPATTSKPAPPAVKGVVLRLQASGGSSWVSVTGSDGNQLYQGVLTDGTAKEFRDAKQLSVRFGNSPAVRITQNGRDMGAPRCDRQVCTVAFGVPAAG
ncbi:MAG TPA: helix-turn-helix domain-containing protein [Mycobacteriales bacterium]|nr:helix-turn-helix domain-containing protein [Mycobacteriales bacterium]